MIQTFTHRQMLTPGPDTGICTTSLPFVKVMDEMKKDLCHQVAPLPKTAFETDFFYPMRCVPIITGSDVLVKNNCRAVSTVV